MNTSFFSSAKGRPLLVDFNQYTDGDDEFKKELIVLMIDNIRELQTSAKIAGQHNDVLIFSKTCHKIKPTLSMLADPELTSIIEAIEQGLSQDKVNLLQVMCSEIIKSLEHERN
jgi:hypothetical protein